MKDKPALQAADMLAWGTNRMLVGDPKGQYRDFAHVLKTLVRLVRIEWDEAKLRKHFCEDL